jgi:ATP-dependent metalloprotease
MKALAEGGEYAGLIKYYEAVALGDELDVRSKVLSKSDEAWAVYIEALGKVGRLSEIAGKVRRRDALLSGLGGSSPASASTPMSTSTSTVPGPAATSTTTSLTTPPSIISSLLTPTNSSSSSSGSSISSTASTLNPSTPHSALTPPGSPLSPIYVQMAPPSKQTSLLRGVRWLLGVLIWGFLILTVLSMVIENTGLLKAGKGPNEFMPEEGKVVKFSDVHGVEEAKSVSRIV